MEIRNEPIWISIFHKQLRIFPKQKNIPKSHSCSQAKTSELTPSAEYHFVGNYSIWAHYKASGADVQDLWRCTYRYSSRILYLSELTCVEDKPAGTRSVTVQ